MVNSSPGDKKLYDLRVNVAVEVKGCMIVPQCKGTTPLARYNDLSKLTRNAITDSILIVPEPYLNKESAHYDGVRIDWHSMQEKIGCY